MSKLPSAFLVARKDDGFGDVYPLQLGTRYRMGRSPANKLALQDDLCSREHAEVYPDANGWFVRDLGSLNGTHVNGEPVRAERSLRPLDEIRVGRTKLVFVEQLSQLPHAAGGDGDGPDRTDGLVIRKRLGTTRYQPDPTIQMEDETVADQQRIQPQQAISVLYRLALDMAGARDLNELCELVVDAIFRATPAEVVAVLALRDNKDPEPVVYRTRGIGTRTYHKVSSFVSHEVLDSKHAVLAANVAESAALKNRDSLTELQISSLICAPVTFGDQFVGLLHLYRAHPAVPLNADDLEFTLAVARQLGAVWHRLRTESSLTAEVRSLKDLLRVESELVGESPALAVVATQVGRVAETKATVLIRGESGSGKELVARAIHQSSPRRDRPFVCLNCAALTESLLESELFGHEKGAFTGATERMIGKFEAADQGTIFLDEIGEMSLPTQAKFLRVLEGHPFERVGGNVAIKADVRVVAATNRPLEDAVRGGAFRRDLFFRLQVVQLDVPPLRDRAADVPLLADHFLKRFVRETGRKIRGFTPAALDKLRGHRWPGNVRELKNVIERAVALGSGPLVDVADVWLSEVDLSVFSDPEKTTPAAGHGAFKPVSLEEIEKAHILETLKYTDWNKSQAAAILGIERSTLDRKIKSYGLVK
ncbi:sigma 54-interacting transcriptional regulator [Gemmata sp.]|uniref:sigma 54-interacting transcriptional regulator n=1 Tax=Gemmata sp. TaxID=1914242 RepID=UPI003F7166E0